MKYTTAIEKSRSGEFKFVYYPVNGNNEVKYQTSSGKWKTKIIKITGVPALPSWGQM